MTLVGASTQSRRHRGPPLTVALSLAVSTAMPGGGSVTAMQALISLVPSRLAVAVMVSKTERSTSVVKSKSNDEGLVVKRVSRSCSPGPWPEL